MASPFALASALSRIVRITCPHCGHKKAVDRSRKVTRRVCPKCRRQFPDPLAKKRR